MKAPQIQGIMDFAQVRRQEILYLPVEHLNGCSILDKRGEGYVCAFL